MTESIHIFDEFSSTSSDLSADQRHTKRSQVEPLLYDILKRKYMPLFDTYWQTANIPKTSEMCVVLVERRIHPNLEFVLKNAAYYARGCSIAIVCSDVNLKYCESLLGPQKGFVNLIPYFQGNPSSQRGKEEYNTLLCTKEFYELFSSPSLLLMEMDTYLRKPIPQELFKYDYVAAPYLWNQSMLGGGLNFRNRSAMLRIAEKVPPSSTQADIWVCEGIPLCNLRVPSFEEALPFFTESCIYEDPVGVHQWWTFFDTSLEDADLFFHNLLTCELIPSS